MAEENINNRKDEAAEVIEVTPVDSPSQNYLVIQHLQRMPALFSRGLVYIILLFIISALLYAILGKIDIVVESRSIARPISHKLKILSDRNGYIEKVFISEGHQVENDAPLFLIRSKEALTYRSRADELRQAIPLKQKYYDTKISAARDELIQLESNYNKSLSLKNLKLQQNKLILETIDADLDYWKQEVSLYTEEVARVEKLYQRGVISIREYNFSKVRLEKARTELEKSLSGRQITLRENSIIREEIEKEKANFHSQKLILQKQMNNLQLEEETTLNTLRNELDMNEKMLSMQDDSYTGAEKEAEKIIRAENAGTISELYFRNVGEYVREADLLCTILPADRRLYMDITVANKDIGFIEKGMEIKFKFDAYPYVDYGVLYGTVSAVSPSAVENGASDMVYHVNGVLNESHFKIKGEIYPIKAGMTATAELITEEKSFFSILFQKFKK